MNTPLLMGVLTLGIVDSLNPFSIAAQAYLLGTPRPRARAWTFLLGSFLIYFLAGVFIVQGAAILVRSVLPMLPPWFLASGALALGIASLLLAFYLWKQAKAGTAFVPPANLSVPATFAFAAVSTVSDLPTALPYFGAAAQIAASTSEMLPQLGWLLIYNLVYVAPLFLLIALHDLLGERSDAVFGRIQRVVNWGFAHLLPPLILILGLGLIYWATAPLILTL
jgi:cytochrome c biogenesis protein CcdA